MVTLHKSQEKEKNLRHQCKQTKGFGKESAQQKLKDDLTEHTVIYVDVLGIFESV